MTAISQHQRTSSLGSGSLLQQNLLTELVLVHDQILSIVM